MAFIDAHATEVAAAVLAAPSFLSGLTPAELGVVKQRIEARANPEIAEAKAETAKALQETEAGWRHAISQISERAGLTKGPDGTWRVILQSRKRLELWRHAPAHSRTVMWMSAYSSKAEIPRVCTDVRYVPRTDIDAPMQLRFARRSVQARLRMSLKSAELTLSSRAGTSAKCQTRHRPRSGIALERGFTHPRVCGKTAASLARSFLDRRLWPTLRVMQSLSAAQRRVSHCTQKLE